MHTNTKRCVKAFVDVAKIAVRLYNLIVQRNAGRGGGEEYLETWTK